MKKKDSSTGNNDTYVKQQQKLRKSIRDIITRGKERGYMFLTQKPTKNLNIRVGARELNVPKPVKNPGPATINRLQKIRDELYKKAIWIDPFTGFKYTGEEGRKIEQSRAAMKGVVTRQKNKVEAERPPDVIQPPPEVKPYWADIASVRESIMLLANHTESWPAMEEAKRRAGRGMIRLLEDKIEQHKKNKTLFEYSEYLRANASVIAKAIDAILPDSNFTHIENQCSAVRKMINEGELNQRESEYYGGEYDNPYDDTEAEE